MVRKWDSYTPVEGVSFALSVGIIRDILPAMRLSVGQIPPGAALASKEVAQDIASLTKQIGDAEMEAERIWDPTPMKTLVSPVYYDIFASTFNKPLPPGTRMEGKRLDLQVRAVYVLPGDMAIADVFAVWQLKFYDGDKLVLDTGRKEYPQFPVVRKTSDGWRLSLIHHMETSASTWARPTAMIPAKPTSRPPPPDNAIDLTGSALRFSDGKSLVQGAVSNNDAYWTATDIVVTITLRDSNRKIVLEDKATIDRTTLRAGERARYEFVVPVSLRWGWAWETYTPSVEWEWKSP